MLPGFVDTHIHLDKACLLGRCGHDHGSLGEVIRAVSAMKRDFTVEDVYARGAKVILDEDTQVMEAIQQSLHADAPIASQGAFEHDNRRVEAWYCKTLGEST